MVYSSQRLSQFRLLGVLSTLNFPNSCLSPESSFTISSYQGIRDRAQNSKDTIGSKAKGLALTPAWLVPVPLPGGPPASSVSCALLWRYSLRNHANVYVNRLTKCVALVFSSPLNQRGFHLGCRVHGWLGVEFMGPSWMDLWVVSRSTPGIPTCLPHFGHMHACPQDTLPGGDSPGAVSATSSLSPWSSSC